jgi:hypothetical protein
MFVVTKKEQTTRLHSQRRERCVYKLPRTGKGPDGGHGGPNVLQTSSSFVGAIPVCLPYKLTYFSDQAKVTVKTEKSGFTI